METLKALLNLDAKSIMSVLFWGNMTSAVLIASYRFSSKHIRNQKFSRYYFLAKACQTVAYLCLFLRHTIPDVVSVNIGNSFLFVGFYLEADAMLLIVNEHRKKNNNALKKVCLACLVLFNAVTFLWPVPLVRVVTAAICLFLILTLPNVKMQAYPNVSRFNRIIGLFYILFAALLLPKAVYALFHYASAAQDAFIESLTLISLVMLMVFGLAAYLLLLKDHADRVISHLAVTDPLTGLPDRAGFLEIADTLFERNRRSSTYLTVLFIDIDYFKEINDTYGHSLGDEVLVVMSSIIRGNLRDGDLCCRYGEEEFVIILTKTNFEKAKLITSRIRKSIGDSAFRNQPGFSFTVSIGVMSGIPDPNEPLSDYLEYADKALYRAKNSGRNKVVEYRP
jgi:diguanylate cyclase (GGDEF)-like protein